MSAVQKKIDLEFAKAWYPILKAQSNYYEFVKQAWLWVEGPNKPFIDNWHIGAVCEHLEACFSGQISNLLMNFPPRCMKTTLCSVCLVPWWWLHDATTQFFYASFGMDLAIRDSVRTRRLIESDWYQKNWGHLYSLSDDQNTKKKFENSRLGFRACTSVGSVPIGQGGDVLICDDPNMVSLKKTSFEEDPKTENVNEWFSGTWSTRANNFKKVVNIVIQQRTKEMDLSGYIMKLEENTQQKWTKLILPMEYDPKRKAKTIILPSTKGKTWEDPRTKEGELLFPNFIGVKELEKIKTSLGSSYRIAGQLQQLPAPSEGGIIKSSWFRLWKEEKPPKCNEIIQSWDTALEADEMNDYSACTTWGLFQDENHVDNLILLSVWRGKVEYPDLRKMAQRLYNDYRDTGEADIIPDGKHVPHLVLVESKVSGHSLIQDLQRAGVICVGFNPGKYGDKISRVRKASLMIEGGRVWLPARPPSYTVLRGFSQLLLDMCTIFPNGDSRDVVDTMSQVLLRLQANGYLVYPKDPQSQGKVKPKHAFYEPTVN